MIFYEDNDNAWAFTEEGKKMIQKTDNNTVCINVDDIDTDTTYESLEK